MPTETADLARRPGPDAVRAVRCAGQALQGLACLGAWYLVLAGLATNGLLMSLARSALDRGDPVLWPVGYALAGLAAVFYGSTAAGMLLMDQARGRPPRDPADALHDALRCGHRLAWVLLRALALAALGAAAVAALLALAPLPWVGPLAFGAAVPVGVLGLGGALLLLVGVVTPMAAPAVWDGRRAREAWALVRRRLRQGLIDTLVHVGAVALMSAVVAATMAFVTLAGARAVAWLALAAAGVDLPPQQFLAGVFGWGWRSLGMAGAPAAGSAPGAAALVAGGLVFALGLAAPTLVYLRGLCAVYLALAADQPE